MTDLAKVMRDLTLIQRELEAVRAELAPTEDLSMADRMRRLSTYDHQYRKVDLQRSAKSGGEDNDDSGHFAPVALEEANLVTSLISETRHTVVVDVDLPCHVEPSSTRGHYHLFIDKELDWGEYQMLLQVLVLVGIVEEGYLKAAQKHGFTAVRLPWVRKEQVA